MATKRSWNILILNPLSMLGILLAAAGFAAGVTLITLDSIGGFSNPYVGIFTYMVVPVILTAGLAFIALGAWRQRRRRLRAGHWDIAPLPTIDLNRPSHFAAVVSVVLVTIAFAAISSVGSYHAYNFTESVTFCGQICHTVMKPEYTAYHESPHANVLCVKCHIGPGASWFVKAKISGLWQVWAVLANDFHRPVETPITNLRPARETCEECHWPAKFHQATELSHTYYRPDEKNSPWTIHMLMKIGGGNPSEGPVHGIHWHVSSGTTVEYLATDQKRQTIPWVRVIDPKGGVKIYKTQDFDMSDADIAKTEVRTVDCIDCHNRPSHQYDSPDHALDIAMGRGLISPKIASIKTNASEALLGDYKTHDEALTTIADKLHKDYPDGGAEVEEAIKSVHAIYAGNFFPEMKVRWDEYPNNVGHLIFPGCFRCHDGEHYDEEGTPISRECTKCHAILAQGPGTNPTSECITPEGLDFVHPFEAHQDDLKKRACDSCHDGTPM